MNASYPPNKPTDFVMGPLQTKWLEALKSGNFAKGKNVLCYKMQGDDTLRYCCLGVLCEIMGVEKTPLIQDQRDFTNFAYENNTIHLSISTYKKLKLRSNSGIFFRDNGLIGEADIVRLTDINDMSDLFQPIIDLMENHPEWMIAEPA